MKSWISKSEIINGLIKKDTSVFKHWKGPYCISDDYKTCLFIQKHEAWGNQNEGWRDRNAPPEKSSSGREMINIIHLDQDNNSIWFKMFIPLKLKTVSLQLKGSLYEISSQVKTYKGEFENLKNLMFKVLSGNAQTEDEIENKFELLNIK